MRKLLLLFALSSAPAWGVAALVQATNTLSFSSTAAGNMLIVGCHSASSSDTVTSVTDSQSNVWTRIAWTIGFSSSAFPVYVYTTPNIHGGALTVTFNSATCLRAWLHEFSGMSATGDLDGSVLIAIGPDSTACNPGSLTTTNAADVIFSIGMSNDGTAGKEATTPDLYTVGASAGSEDSEYRVVSATGTYTPSFTSSQAWTCIGAAFKQAGSAPAAVPARRIIN